MVLSGRCMALAKVAVYTLRFLASWGSWAALPLHSSSPNGTGTALHHSSRTVPTLCGSKHLSAKRTKDIRTDSIYTSVTEKVGYTRFRVEEMRREGVQSNVCTRQAKQQYEGLDIFYPSKAIWREEIQEEVKEHNNCTRH